MKQPETPFIVVIGGARSGIAAASLLYSKGKNVFLSDNNPIQPDFKKRLETEGIPYEENGHSGLAEKGIYAVVSPGVPTSAPVVQHYLNSGKRVISEIELASGFCESTIVAVTGTNGKTTVTNWLDFTWETANKPHITAGNIGNAFSDMAEHATPEKTAILEVSSFQLDHIEKFQPHVSLLLNITPDHLDRYNHSFEAYAKAKFRIFQNQNKYNWLIYNYDDQVIRHRIEKLRSQSQAPRLLPFSLKKELKNGAYIKDEAIFLNLNQKKERLMRTREVSLPGMHNLKNGMATALAARALEIQSEYIRESLKTFEGVEHRLEFVRDLNGIKFINDSKATNINAVWYALESIDAPVVLILGGRDKGNDYSELHELIYQKVHTIIAIGEARQKIKDQVGKVVPSLFLAGNLDEAVDRAFESAQKGDCVLLSTACASFDMFENYEHRGNEFKKLVHDL